MSVQRCENRLIPSRRQARDTTTIWEVPVDIFGEGRLSYVLQFEHLEKRLEGMPGATDENIAALFGLDVEAYRSIRGRYASRARQAAQELIAEPAFAALVDRLPFRAGDVVVGLGDSITDDDQSWLEIMRALLESRRGEDSIRVVNAGVSGDTTAQMIARFLDVIVEDPDWIICMPGTNDARLHGAFPTKVLVSIEETARNLDMLRHMAATQTQARWIWMTPVTVIEAQIADHWMLSGFELGWRNSDLLAVGDVIDRRPEPVVDLRKAFGRPPDAKFLLPDGLHPSLQGQVAIVRALVRRLAEESR
jgi:acyl-CoA thioesterase-1